MSPSRALDVERFGKEWNEDIAGTEREENGGEGRRREEKGGERKQRVGRVGGYDSAGT